MALRISLAQKGLILVAVPLAFELIFVATLFQLLLGAKNDAVREANAKQTLVITNELGKLSFDSSSALVTYALTKNHIFETRFLEIIARIREDLHALKARVIADASLTLLALRIELVENTILDLLEKAKNGLGEGQGTGALLGDDRAKILQVSMSKLLLEIQRFGEFEGRVEIESAGAQSRSEELVIICLAGGVAFNILLATGLALFFNRGTARRLGRLMDNTLLLKKGKELNPPLEGADEIAHLDNVFHDMAKALAESMRKERATIENAVDIICSLDADGKFIAANPATLQIWGYSPDELKGRDYAELVAPNDLVKTRSYFEELMQGKTAAVLENRISKADGSVAEMMWSAHWSPLDRCWFCVAHDITDRKELEQLRQQFVSMVSHDLRTPLNSVQNFFYLLNDGAYGEVAPVLLNRSKLAETNVERLIRLVNDLLDTERIEAGRLSMNCRNTDVAPLIESALDAVRGFADQQEVSLASEPTDLRIYADGDRIVQVLVNFLGNAIKFSPVASTIWVTAQRHDDWIEMRVKDQGRGIPESHRHLIFDKFEQTEADDSSVKGGAGLGLAISRAIVEAHGGIIGVESQVGKGSRFWIRIAAAAAPTLNGSN